MIKNNNDNDNDNDNVKKNKFDKKIVHAILKISIIIFMTIITDIFVI